MCMATCVPIPTRLGQRQAEIIEKLRKLIALGLGVLCKDCMDSSLPQQGQSMLEKTCVLRSVVHASLRQREGLRTDVSAANTMDSGSCVQAVILRSQGCPASKAT